MQKLNNLFDLETNGGAIRFFIAVLIVAIFMLAGLSAPEQIWQGWIEPALFLIFVVACLGAAVAFALPRTTR